MMLHQLFCDIDDFCQTYLPRWKQTLLETEQKRRQRPRMLSESEVMTIAVYFQMSVYRRFKWYYQQYVLVHLRDEFPRLPSYNRFVELMSEMIIPLAAFMQSRCQPSRGIAFIDSTALKVCTTLRIPHHRTFAGLAGRSKSSTGWFYGFKLHFVVNDSGEIVSFCLTPANTDDRTPVPFLAKHLLGKLFGDRGYISEKLTQLLATQDVELITTVRNNMKPKVLKAFDKLLLRKRSIIETINDQLKNIFSLEHSRQRSLFNFLLNALASLIAYSYQPKKPSLQLAHKDFSVLVV